MSSETDTDPDTLLALLPPAGGVAKPISNAAPLAGGARAEPKDTNQPFRGAAPAAAVPPNPKTFIVSGSCYFCQQAVESTEAAILMPCNHAVHLRCGVPPLVAGKWRCFVCQKNAAPIAFSKDIVSIGINGAQLSLLTEKMYAEYQQNTVSRENTVCAFFCLTFCMRSVKVTPKPFGRVMTRMQCAKTITGCLGGEFCLHRHVDARRSDGYWLTTRSYEFGEPARSLEAVANAIRFSAFRRHLALDQLVACGARVPVLIACGITIDELLKENYTLEHIIDGLALTWSTFVALGFHPDLLKDSRCPLIVLWTKFRVTASDFYQFYQTRENLEECLGVDGVAMLAPNWRYWA